MFGGPGSSTQVMSTLKRRESFSWFDGASGRFQRLRRKMRSHSVDGYDYSPPVSPTSKSGESRRFNRQSLFYNSPGATHSCWIIFLTHVAFQYCCNIPHHIAHYLVLRYTLFYIKVCVFRNYLNFMILSYILYSGSTPILWHPSPKIRLEQWIVLRVCWKVSRCLNSKLKMAALCT